MDLSGLQKFGIFDTVTVNVGKALISLIIDVSMQIRISDNTIHLIRPPGTGQAILSEQISEKILSAKLSYLKISPNKLIDEIVSYIQCLTINFKRLEAKSVHNYDFCVIWFPYQSVLLVLEMRC